MKELISTISLLYSIPVCRIVSLKEEKVFTVITKTERFVLKLLPYPAMETAFITDTMVYLSNSGFHDFNEIIFTAEGKPTGKFQDRFTLLTKELKGRVPSYKKREDVTAVSMYLASLHHAASHFFPIHSYPDRIKWGKMIETMNTGKNDLIQLKNEISSVAGKKSDFDTAFLTHCDTAIQEIETAIFGLKPFYSDLSNDARKRGGFCHHDPAHHNFLIDDHGIVTGFDFDYAIADIPAHDVAALLLKILKTNHWHPAAAKCCLSAYSSQAYLSENNLKYIYYLLVYPYDFYHAAYARYREHNFSRRIEKKLFRLIAEREKRKSALAELRPYLLENSESEVP